MKKIEDLKFQIESGCRFCNPPEKERILFIGYLPGEKYFFLSTAGPTGNNWHCSYRPTG